MLLSPIIKLFLLIFSTLTLLPIIEFSDSTFFSVASLSITQFSRIHFSILELAPIET